MFGFRYRYCEARMVAFLNGELSPKSRRRVARYIEECPRCYAEYVRQRELQRELASGLPVLGQPRPEQMNRIWTGIHREIFPAQSRPSRPHYFRSSLVTLASILVMVLSLLLLDKDRTLAAMVTQPSPGGNRTTVMTNAPQATQVAVVTLPVDSTHEVNTIVPEAAPQYTPQPGQ